MREAVCRLYEWRKTGLLCDLGPAKFQPPSKFLAQAVKQTKRSHVIPPWCDLVVFADVHGDFLALLSHLYLAKVIDEQGLWIGGNRWVCSTGDWIDRAGRGDATVDTSHNPREEVDILQYVHALNLSAAEEGGGVLFTLGNHELRRVQDAAEGQVGHHAGDQVAGWSDEKVTPAEALKNMNRLWAPKGLMAQYLARNCPAIAKYGGKGYGTTLLMHGGLESAFARAGVDELANRCAVLFLRTGEQCEADGLLDHVTLTRALGSGVCPVEDVEKTLRLTRARQLVIGHTVQSRGDSPAACGGQVWRLDFGMSEAFGSEGSVNVLLLKPIVEKDYKHPSDREATFVTSSSSFQRAHKTYETRRDVRTTFVNGVETSSEGHLIERKVPKRDMANLP
jgi:hypothetical protein